MSALTFKLREMVKLENFVLELQGYTEHEESLRINWNLYYEQCIEVYNLIRLVFIRLLLS